MGSPNLYNISSKGDLIRDRKVYSYGMTAHKVDKSVSFMGILASSVGKPDTLCSTLKVYSYGTLLRKGDFSSLYVVHLSGIFGS